MVFWLARQKLWNQFDLWFFDSRGKNYETYLIYGFLTREAKIMKPIWFIVFWLARQKLWNQFDLRFFDSQGKNYETYLIYGFLTREAKIMKPI